MNRSEPWYCVRSKPKHEQIAAASLREAGLEAFAPMIKFKRTTCRGPSWFVEALFPGYLFAKFDWPTRHKLVQHANGVIGIVRFGEHCPTIAEEVISELRATMAGKELHVIETPPTEGDEVRVATGAFQGLSGIITQVVRSEERVRVLLEFLGRQTSVELPASHVLKPNAERSFLA
ncbi:MAG TPA: transcription termination/antitermination NusG family protein [Methylomirabilota bacterium]|nr:transcription termination/antitermination NusG family protein [Methylomirabilota bacterium]